MQLTDVPHLSSAARAVLEADGIEELYPPQAAAVEAGITEGTNLVASVPTASGKTLIATLAMVSAIERGGMALYIVPLRALASEKRAEFAAFEEAGIEVGVSTGNYESTDEWLASRDLIVATSEKVDSLIRNGASWIGDITCVVADEVHLVDDAHRGPTLEVTLAKLMRISPTIQLVALSATVGNASEIADWIDAALVDSDWRPIELRRGVHYGNALHFDDGSTSELPVDANEEQTAAIVRDTLADGGSTLVFVNSRRNAEAAAGRLANVVGPELDEADRDELAEVAADLRSASDTETSSDLADAVAKGVAFHHAGLVNENRAAVEDAFRARAIKVVCATPTLAAGVNTPSRRVIVRDWRRYDGSVGGMTPLSTLEVHQMCGRAGRPGLDPYGEALLLAGSHDELDELFERYVHAEPEPVRSKLAVEPALRTHVLSTIADGFATSDDELLEFLDGTLYAAQAADQSQLAAVARRVTEYLLVNDFLSRDGERLRATGLGHTVSQLYIDPMSAAEIIDGLRATDEEPTAFGLYHLVARTPDLYELYLRSGDYERYVDICYEREDEFLGPMPSEFEDHAFEDWLAAIKTAHLLEQWADEVDEGRLTDRFGIGPGDIRGKVETTDWLLEAAERLTMELELPGAPAIARARNRVSDGVREELLDLVNVDNVGRKRARRLYDAGITSRTELREADPAVVLRALEGRRRTTESILENVGHPDPSLEGVRAPASSSSEDGEDQASLGDFS